jgi:ribonuclease HI
MSMQQQTKDMHDGAVGVVYRSEAGLFLGASSLKIQGIADPPTLEAIACREAIALAQDLNLQQITVATDSSTVVNDMVRPYVGRYSTMIPEIKELLVPFSEITSRHENRASNCEVHRLS